MGVESIVIVKNGSFGYSEADIQAALDVITDLQWFMSYELANTYSNFDGKKFEELCKA